MFTMAQGVMEKEQNLMMAQDFRNSERQQGRRHHRRVSLGGDETHHVAPVPVVWSKTVFTLRKAPKTEN
jgi:hypothetical protein